MEQSCTFLSCVLTTGGDTEAGKELDSLAVTAVNANLTAGVDLTKAVRLTENASRSFIGDMKKRQVRD